VPSGAAASSLSDYVSGMRVGVGLPNSIPGTSGRALLEWARRAEELGFSSLGVVDRLVWDCFEPLTALAAAAVSTERIELATTIVIGPLRNTALLANEAATVDSLSGGRLTLGLSVGARSEDFDVAGVDHRGRGDRLTDQLVELRRRWDGSSLATRPARAGGPRLLVGGTSDLSFYRMARHSDGYVHGGGPPRAFERAAGSARAAWAEAGRPGAPLLWGQGYFALGDDAKEAGERYMRDYYAFVGPFVEQIVEGLLTTPQDVLAFVRGYSESGCDELVLMPGVSDPTQLDRLAQVLAGATR
jgi:alkanesulfonate monooxygenase SsuD/methylene tetrahydromethanopterin reductase-like flavin-dependent oxidoreductase (luciferase family)